jgi:hypothetical protein
METRDVNIPGVGTIEVPESIYKRFGLMDWRTMTPDPYAPLIGSQGMLGGQTKAIQALRRIEEIPQRLGWLGKEAIPELTRPLGPELGQVVGQTLEQMLYGPLAREPGFLLEEWKKEPKEIGRKFVQDRFREGRIGASLILLPERWDLTGAWQRLVGGNTGASAAEIAGIPSEYEIEVDGKKVDAWGAPRTTTMAELALSYGPRIDAVREAVEAGATWDEIEKEYGNFPIQLAAGLLFDPIMVVANEYISGLVTGPATIQLQAGKKALSVLSDGAKKMPVIGSWIAQSELSKLRKSTEAVHDALNVAGTIRKDVPALERLHGVFVGNEEIVSRMADEDVGHIQRAIRSMADMPEFAAMPKGAVQKATGFLTDEGATTAVNTLLQKFGGRIRDVDIEEFDQLRDFIVKAYWRKGTRDLDLPDASYLGNTVAGTKGLLHETFLGQTGNTVNNWGNNAVMAAQEGVRPYVDLLPAEAVVAKYDEVMVDGGIGGLTASSKSGLVRTVLSGDPGKRRLVLDKFPPPRDSQRTGGRLRGSHWPRPSSPQTITRR